MAKYSSLDHGGLEVREQHEAPEVVPERFVFAPKDRKSSLNQPEAIHAAPYAQEKQEYRGHYGSDLETVESPPPSDSTKPLYMTQDGQGGGWSSQEPRDRRNGRRYCGMRKSICISLIVAVILLVCVAAVLGGVLGTILPQDEYVLYGPRIPRSHC